MGFVVNIVPHGNTCAEHCTQIGAQWNSQSPTKAILTIGVLGYTGFRNIEKVELRIGKDVRVLEPNPGITRHVKERYMIFYELKKTTPSISTWFATSLLLMMFGCELAPMMA